jgi:hypothetical protein
VDVEPRSEAVRAEWLAERFLQGASIGELARVFGLSTEQAEEAVRLAVATMADAWASSRAA